MYQVKITTKKKEKMSEHAEQALRHMGKLMQCIEDLGEDELGERENGGRYGSINERYTRTRMNGRDDWEEDDDDDYPMGERRRRGSNGRYK